MSESEHGAAAPLRVALLGCGVVGSSVARMLTEHADDLAARVGRPLELIGIAVRRAGKDRSELPVDPALFTTDAESIITRADIVIEVIGGIEPARSLIELAMKSGASVVSANKALLAEAGPALYAEAAEHGVDLYYEAAVAGAIPILRPIRESLAGDEVRKVIGIVNGTTNYVLDKMDTHRAGLRRGGRAGAGAGLRGGRPDRRRRGLRRRGQGRDPRLAGLPHPGVERPGLPRGHHRGERRRHPGRARDGLCRQAARDLRAHRDRSAPTADDGRGERPGAPGDDPAVAPARWRPRRLQRRLRRGRRRGPADVLRQGSRRRPHGQRPSSATSSPWPGTAWVAVADTASPPTPTCPSSRWARP